jgi:hypothetical protein
MTIEVSWGNPEHTVIHMNFVPGWTYEEVLTAMNDMADMLDTVQRPVVVIGDLRTSRFAPNLSVSTYKRIAETRFLSHPNLARFCLLGVQTYVRMLVITFGKLFPKAYVKFRMVETVEEALQYLHPSKASKPHTDFLGMIV